MDETEQASSPRKPRGLKSPASSAREQIRRTIGLRCTERLKRSCSSQDLPACQLPTYRKAVPGIVGCSHILLGYLNFQSSLPVCARPDCFRDRMFVVQGLFCSMNEECAIRAAESLHEFRYTCMLYIKSPEFYSKSQNRSPILSV